MHGSVQVEMQISKSSRVLSGDPLDWRMGFDAPMRQKLGGETGGARLPPP